MSCNSSLIVLLALCAVLATPLLLQCNSPTLCCSLIENTSLHRVRIHFHVLFKASPSIRSALSRIELLLFVSAAELFLADMIPRLQQCRRRRLGDTTAFAPTAQSSLKTQKKPDIRCRLWPTPAAVWAGLRFPPLMARVLTVSCLYLTGQN